MPDKFFGDFFAITQIILSLAAAVGYFWVGDIRRGIYWLAAAVLTSTVTC